jgi:hypothetical protein
LRSGALAHLVDRLGLEAVGLAMDERRGRRVGCLDEAEQRASLLVDPIALVVDAVLALHAEVGRMRVGALTPGTSWMSMNVALLDSLSATEARRLEALLRTVLRVLEPLD